MSSKKLDFPRHHQHIQSFSDEDLVTAIATNNASALRELHKRYAPGLHAFLLHEHPNLQDIDFQLQDMFYQIWSRKVAFNKSSYDSVHSWLFEIARTRASVENRQLETALSNFGRKLK